MEHNIFEGIAIAELTQVIHIQPSQPYKVEPL